MHDTVRLERKGIPTVVLVHDRFEVAAKSQARILGLPSAKIVILREGLPGETAEELLTKIDGVWNDIVANL
ncbi:MAG: hypothetical protein A3G80_07635 [Betaproteobacteria bacterium RIFCSPLOWO2_12_FULL_62_13b]|nr:MAG: hypothetical protein A3G80_07635 [Betaproteobacteria bacterium RIFCSPLOWO2_12_FULL_62_13b]